MITINFFERGCGFKVTNDKTFEDMVIYPRDYDHEQEIVSELLERFVMAE